MDIPLRTRVPRTPLAMVLAVAAVVVGLLPTPASGQESERVTPARVAGDDRYATAADIARLTYQQADVAHIVSGEDFPDALAASYAAGRTDGPILLVEHLRVPDATLRALEDLGVATVVIVGGAAAVSNAVEAQLTAAGYDTDRIVGVDRYQTASAVAMRYGSGPTGEVGTLDGDRTAILASGEDFPDALAAGPFAVSAKYPLFLTPHGRPDVSANQSLQQLDVERVLIVGGPTAVSTVAEEELRGQGYTVERLAGTTRTGTARAVADFARTRLQWAVDLTLLARGDGFADALAGSAHGGVTASPILLTETPTSLGDETREWLRDRCPAVEAVRALGGTSAVSQAVLADAVDRAGECRTGTDPSQDFLVAPQEVVTGVPGDTQEFRVSRRFDGADFTGPVDVALFPCTNVDATANPVPFVDADADGVADGLGTSDTGAARITQENDRPVNTTVVRGIGPAADGVLRVFLHSSEVDCTVLVVWDDEDADGVLDLDAQGQATEPFGVGQMGWETV